MQTAPRPGSILLGKYRVEKVLGQGGMGVVVAARHLHLGELFAIKLMLPAALEHPDALARFMREARASARLKTEHVARVHDVGMLDDGAPFMVMEHLQGQDLHTLLNTRGHLSVRESAFYVSQACEALAEAHANGIVHRDLKPSNLFLTQRVNGTPCIKVLDFGISKELGVANRLGVALTRTGTFMGTPLYMSPEQMEDVKAADPRSDIWALGIMLYELATGYVPFAAEAVTELVSKVLTKRPAPPSRLNSEIPLEFDAVVLRCLEKKPAKRFASVKELSAALAPFLVETPNATPQGPKITPKGTILMASEPVRNNADPPDSVTLVKPLKSEQDDDTTVPMKTRQSSSPQVRSPARPVNAAPLAAAPTLVVPTGPAASAMDSGHAVMSPRNRFQLLWTTAGVVFFVVLGFGLAYLMAARQPEMNVQPAAAPSAMTVLVETAGRISLPAAEMVQPASVASANATPSAAIMPAVAPAQTGAPATSHSTPMKKVPFKGVDD